MVGKNNQDRREFLKKVGATSVGISTGATTLTLNTQQVEASATDPHWTLDENNNAKVYGATQPDGTDTWTYTLGSALNYVRTWTPEDSSGDLPAENEFTYAGKGISTFSEAGSSSEEKVSDLQGQGLEVTEYSGASNIKIR